LALFIDFDKTAASNSLDERLPGSGIDGRPTGWQKKVSNLPPVAVGLL
jgi:hypothetical protein